MYAFKQRAFEQDKPTYPTLPDGMQRSDVERLLRRIRRHIGLSTRQLDVVLEMIAMTRPRDWIEPGQEPVCFARQITIAGICGLSERSVRRTEALLVDLGLCRKEVAANGQRSRFLSAEEESCNGIFFSPLIEAVPQLLAIEAEVDHELQEVQILKQKISAGRRIVKEQLMQLQGQYPANDQLKALTERFLSWPTRFSAQAASPELQHLLSDVVDVVDKLEGFDEKTPKESGQADSRVRPLQETNHDPYVSCNARVRTSPACKQAEPYYHDSPSNDGLNASEKKYEAAAEARNSEFWTKLTPIELLDLCSETMRDLVAEYQGDAPYPNHSHFIWAAIDRRSDLGISKSAYDDATHQMGDLFTAFCTIIIDQNTQHPLSPIKNPGGYLRDMTRRHKNGSLNIVGNMKGIKQRLDGTG